MLFWRRKKRNSNDALDSVAEVHSDRVGFIAFDVETANSDPASICQIGIAIYENNRLTQSRSYLLDPECEFSDHHVSIHQIVGSDVENSPTFSELFPTLTALISNRSVVSHTMFDQNALKKVCAKYQVEFPDVDWVDSSMIARRAWPEVSKRGYGLEALCQRISFNYSPHDAEEDAIACGEVVLAALESTGWSFDQAVLESRSRNSSPMWSSKNVTRDGDEKGEFFGKILVFTGDLPNSRSEAASKAAELGFTVKNHVSRKTDILVLGDNGEGTTKHKRALDLIDQGHIIEIVSFNEIVEPHS